MAIGWLMMLEDQSPPWNTAGPPAVPVGGAVEAPGVVAHAGESHRLVALQCLGAPEPTPDTRVVRER